MIITAWQIANLQRAKRLPALSKLLPDDGTAKRSQSPAEMRKVLDTLAGMATDG